MLYTDLIAVVDLEEEDVEEVDIEEEFIEESIGGAAANMTLLKEYPGSLILGTGALTGTLCPGSSVGIVTAERNGTVCHSAFNWFAGTELKLSGFSFVVIKGKASDPVYLWLHDEIADIEKTDLWGKNTWETTDILRDELGEDRIQTLVIGEGGEKQSGASLLVNNYWGCDDRNALASAFGERNMKAVAMRGMGEIEIDDPETFTAQAENLLSHFRSAVKKKGTPIEGLDAITHRYDACFNCPYPCRNFVMTGEEKGVLTFQRHLADLISHGLDVKEAVTVLEECYKYGVNPHYGTDPKALVTMEPQPVQPLESHEAWYYTMGICPILNQFSVDRETILNLVNSGTGLDLSQEDVDAVISTV